MFHRFARLAASILVLLPLFLAATDGVAQTRPGTAATQPKSGTAKSAATGPTLSVKEAERNNFV